MHKNEKYAKIAYGAGFFFKYTNETKIYMSVVSKRSFKLLWDGRTTHSLVGILQQSVKLASCHVFPQYQKNSLLFE